MFELFVKLLYFQLARFDFSDIAHHDHHTHHFSVGNVWDVLHHQVVWRAIRQGQGALKALYLPGKRRFKPRLIVVKQHRSEQLAHVNASHLLCCHAEPLVVCGIGELTRPRLIPVADHAGQGLGERLEKALALAQFVFNAFPGCDISERGHNLVGLIVTRRPHRLGIDRDPGDLAIGLVNPHHRIKHGFSRAQRHHGGMGITRPRRQVFVNTMPGRIN